uniref:DH domain-containing protein n=1 Tax=Plectus sambesii TaxID=2011161 RepID=A0A914WNC1_9BILA
MAPPSPSMSIDNTTAREDQEEMMREVEVQRRDSVRRQHLRNKVVEEILSSERAYLGHLNILMRVFVDGLSLVSKKVIAPAELRTLFGEIRSIRLINQVLCDHLSGGDVVGAFATLTPFLKLYSSYARNFPSSQHLLNDLMKRADFDQFVRAQEALPVCCGIKLPGFLIMPIQRIPRYKLLLQEFLKYTSTLQERSQVTGLCANSRQIFNGAYSRRGTN